MVVAGRALSRARLVSRREVRDLGALGAAMSARVRRLVRAADVHAGQMPLACRAKRPTSTTSAATAIRAAPVSSTSSVSGRPRHWQPEHLLKRYVKAGARYFMAMGCHHDNFDLFASRHHAWNSTRVGPKRDIVGTWEPLVRDAGA